MTIANLSEDTLFHVVDYTLEACDASIAAAQAARERTVRGLEHERASHLERAQFNRWAAKSLNAQIRETYQTHATEASRLAELRALMCAQADDDTPCVEPEEIPLPDASDTATDYDRDEAEAYQIDEDGEADIWERYLWNLERQEKSYRDASIPGECGAFPWDVDRSTDVQTLDYSRFGTVWRPAHEPSRLDVDWGAFFLVAMLRNVRAYA